MGIGKAIGFLVVAVFVIFAMFEVDFVFDVSGSGTTIIADPVAEADYQRCYREKDDEIHSTAFGTIDNPDVQKEFITSNRARAARECRSLHPEKTITVEEPFRFNLVYLTPRFW